MRLQRAHVRIQEKRKRTLVSFRGVVAIWMAYSVANIGYFEANHHSERSLSSIMKEKHTTSSLYGKERAFRDFLITFRDIPTVHYVPFAYPTERIRQPKRKRKRDGPDYGSIESINGAVKLRLIDESGDTNHFNHYRDELLDEMDAHDGDEYDRNLPDGCRDVAWRYDQHPTCNEMHSILLETPIQSIDELQDFNITYLR